MGVFVAVAEYNIAFDGPLVFNGFQPLLWKIHQHKQPGQSCIATPMI